MELLKIGIVGAGRLGGFHADKVAAKTNAQLVGVVDPVLESRKRIAQKYNIEHYDRIEDILPSVDAVVIAAPSVLHYELVKIALEQGKHVLVEKPMTTHGAHATELVKLAENKGLVLQTGHVEEYNPAWIAVQKWFTGIQQGKRCVIDAVRTSGYTFRSVDTGAVYDLMIHDLELILGLIPSPVSRITASGFTQLGGCEDSAFAQMEFANGSIARLTASRIELEAKRQMTIRTDFQTIQIDFQNRQAKRIKPSNDILMGCFSPKVVDSARMTSKASDFMQNSYLTEVLENNPVDALALEMDCFISSVLKKAPARIPVSRAADAVCVADEILTDIKRRSFSVVDRPVTVPAASQTGLVKSA